MADFLLELFCEEMPARMQEAASKQLEQQCIKQLGDARLGYDLIESFVTPRRLAIRVRGLPEKQPDQTIERKGPKASAPDKAIDGFCASVGLNKAQLELRSVGKDEVYFAVIEQSGEMTSAVLKTISETIITQFHWPKSMRWGAFEVSWVRPLRAILCLLDDQIIPVQFGHLEASNQTFGHRFMAPDAITIAHPNDYETALEQAHVIASADQRRQMITKQMEALAEQHDCIVKEDEGLLREVVGLVEYPVALCGGFEASYLSLPPEVLVLEMRHHQKYFALLSKDTSELAPYFITIANIKASDDGAQITAGNERVLRARLDDGVFYWEQDRKKPLSEWAKGLDSMIFHQALGSVAAKVERIGVLAAYLAVFVPHADINHTKRASELCKADLTSGMVGEFPELQGVMGRYYALSQEEPEAVADAIRDHYKPAGANDDLPASPEAIAVALADKLDSIAGLFAADEAPTGSKDPYALRRMALGIIRIIRASELRIPLMYVINRAIAGLPDRLVDQQDRLREQIYHFMQERLKVALKDEGVRYDVIDAICAPILNDRYDDDIVRIVTKAEAIQQFLGSDDGGNMLAAYKRARNIVKKEQQKDQTDYAASYHKKHLVAEEEKALAESLAQVDDLVSEALEAEEYAKAMSALATLRAPLDAFFDQVTVNAPEPDIRENRLQLLVALTQTVHQIGDFSMIEGA